MHRQRIIAPLLLSCFACTDRVASAQAEPQQLRLAHEKPPPAGSSEGRPRNLRRAGARGYTGRSISIESVNTTAFSCLKSARIHQVRHVIVHQPLNAIPDETLQDRIEGRLVDADSLLAVVPPELHNHTGQVLGHAGDVRMALFVVRPLSQLFRDSTSGHCSTSRLGAIKADSRVSTEAMIVALEDHNTAFRASVERLPCACGPGND